jgi:tetratricopeptide (TPR) repeat protein
VSGRPPSTAKARVLATASRLRWIALNDNDEALRAGRDVLAIADSIRVPELEADVLDTIGMIRVNTGDVAGIADVRRGLELALAHNALAEAARACTNLAAVAAFTGSLTEREELLAQSALLSQRLGHVQRIRLLTVYKLTTTTFWRGDWDEALPTADAFIADCEAGAPHFTEALARVVRATIRLGRDDPAGALADCELAVANARAAHVDTAFPVFAAAAAISFELGRLDEARTRMDAAIALDPGWVSVTGPMLAWGAVELGRRREVEAVLGTIRDFELNNPWSRSANLILDERFDEAANIYAHIGAAAYEAHARLRAAATLATQSRHAEARVQLGNALTFFRSVRATRYVRQAETLLATIRPVAESEKERVSSLPASLCQSCFFMRAVRGRHGRQYLLCRNDAIAAKYPRQPVSTCREYAPRDDSGRSARRSGPVSGSG